jgi:hypothetical protein
MIFGVFTAVKSEIMVFCVVTPSSMIPIGLSDRRLKPGRIFDEGMYECKKEFIMQILFLHDV